MTDQIYNDNSQLADLISAGAKQMVDQARALGLTWTLRLATIVTSAGDALTARFDGDAGSIPVTNMTGDVLIAGQRVYGIMINPSGNFIVGYATTPKATALRAVSGGFSLATTTFATVTFTALALDSGWDTSAPTTSFTIPKDGWYSITVSFIASTPGGVNSTQFAAFNVITSVPNSPTDHRSNWSVGGQEATVSVTQLFNGGDTIYVIVFQNTIASDTVFVSLEALLLAPA